jgi:hypothetical protein
MGNIQQIYTKERISIATFFGGPLAAGFLIGHNFKIFGDDIKARYAIILGILSTIILLELIFLIPHKIIKYIPHVLIPVFNTGILYFIVDKTQNQ